MSCPTGTGPTSLLHLFLLPLLSSTWIQNLPPGHFHLLPFDAQVNLKAIEEEDHPIPKQKQTCTPASDLAKEKVKRDSPCSGCLTEAGAPTAISAVGDKAVPGPWLIENLMERWAGTLRHTEGTAG